MINLLASILLATFLVICLKGYERFKINTFQAIVFNYITCVVVGSLYDRQAPDYGNFVQQDWFWIAAYMGATYFIMINIMGYVTQKIGLTVTSIAGKLSMVIPVLVAVYLYHEPFNILKVAGLILALAAVVLSSIKKEEGAPKFSLKYIALPLVLFIGSGINDSLTKYAQLNFLQPEEFASFNITIFSGAAVAGSLTLLFQLVQGSKLEWRSIPAGIILGIPNFFSLQFLLATLNTPGWNSSVIFPINNIGVVAATGIFALLFFREKLSPMNLVGLVLAFLAMVIIFFA